jgi:hypothetical protein
MFCWVEGSRRLKFDFLPNNLYELAREFCQKTDYDFSDSILDSVFSTEIHFPIPSHIIATEEQIHQDVSKI